MSRSQRTSGQQAASKLQSQPLTPSGTAQSRQPDTRGITRNGKKPMDVGVPDGHPTTGASFRCSVSTVPVPPDSRTIPYPLHGKQAKQVHISSGRAAWNWQSYKDWMRQTVARTSWRKTTLQSAIDTRNQEAQRRGDTFDNHDPQQFLTYKGVIYVAFHSSNGRMYVGQTINRVYDRAQDHWYQRGKVEDRLHLALEEATDPVTMIFLPLEYPTLGERKRIIRHRPVTPVAEDVANRKLHRA